MIYNYKSKEIVQDIVVKCLCPIMEDVIDEYSTLRRDEMLAFYVPSELAVVIIERLFDEIEGVSLEDECSEIELLEKEDVEVLVTINENGTIFVENARYKNSNVIKSNEGCVLSYVYDGFRNKDIVALAEYNNSILVFGFEDEFENDEIEDDSVDEIAVDIIEDESGDIHGFTVNKVEDDSTSTYTFYSTGAYSEDDIVKMLSKIWA